MINELLKEVVFAEYGNIGTMRNTHNTFAELVRLTGVIRQNDILLRSSLCVLLGGVAVNSRRE